MNAIVIRTFVERREHIMELEDWLKGVGSLALKEFAGDALEVRETSKPKVIALILSNPDARWAAEESLRIETESQKRTAERGTSAAEEWAKRFALPW